MLASPSDPPAIRDAPNLDLPFQRGGEGGFVLVATLWMLAALAFLASTYSAYTIQTDRSVQLLEGGVQAEASIRAGVEILAYEQLSVAEAARASQGEFSLRIGHSNVAVRFRSEAARIDLNAAPPDLLAGLFLAIGIDSENSQTYADRIVGWRTKSSSGGGDSEAKLYMGAGSPFPPRQAPFDNTLELGLVLGIPMPVVERALPFLTIFSGRSEIDVASADPLVLAALPGMTPKIESAILTARAQAPDDRNTLLSLLGPARRHATANSSRAVRSSIDVKGDDGRRVHAEVVIRLRDEGDIPYDVLSWRDDLDGPTPLAWDSDR